jgi:Tfp pilus assembly protein PilF
VPGVGLVENLESMLAAGRDDALLRFSLGNAYLKTRPALAAEHLARAVELNPDYSAAWKIYGKALVGAGRENEAREAYRRGIDAADRNGDVQAAKEMGVFLRRLERKQTP